MSQIYLVYFIYLQQFQLNANAEDSLYNVFNWKELRYSTHQNNHIRCIFVNRMVDKVV